MELHHQTIHAETATQNVKLFLRGPLAGSPISRSMMSGNGGLCMSVPPKRRVCVVIGSAPTSKCVGIAALLGSTVTRNRLSGAQFARGKLSRAQKGGC
jgi:hypothetical protein